ncbi:hypothetical protein KUTeg_004743 [Tegillarca granosa]|uniref:Uncharacterized protein n=1 Tax=Tegillarca granosa TaxID=220873 RepID=A0ABQ9FHS4_TEGGR|nr:hypothetical protein KUTeg_004743 [Tegillarca granosa]
MASGGRGRVDRIIMLMMVGGLFTFLIAFCGCCGSLRENTLLLKMGDAINILCGKDALKESDPSQLDIINTKGCLKGLGDFIQENAFVIGGVILGVLIPQILFICFAKQLVDQIKMQMAKWR